MILKFDHASFLGLFLKVWAEGFCQFNFLFIVKTKIQINSLQSQNLKIWTLVDNKITRATHPPTTLQLQIDIF